MKYKPPQGYILDWEFIKNMLKIEGAINKMYDPDLDGALGAVSIEQLKLPDDEKIYFGTDARYSMRFDSKKKAIVIRDEVEGKDILEVSYITS